jgi:hypothetical protein
VVASNLDLYLNPVRPRKFLPIGRSIGQCNVGIAEMNSENEGFEILLVSWDVPNPDDQEVLEFAVGAMPPTLESAQARTLGASPAPPVREHRNEV